jgi:cobalamin biosynthesis protein CobT
MRKISRAVVAATAGGALFSVAALGAPAMAEAAQPHQLGCLLHTCESSNHQGHDDHDHDDHDNGHDNGDHDNDHDNGHDHDNGDDNGHDHDNDHEHEPEDDNGEDDDVAEPTAPATAVVGQPALTG